MVTLGPRYADSTEIHAGDRILYNNQFGMVVLVAMNDEYLPEFPKDQWPSITVGFMIRFDNGALFHLVEPDSLLERAPR